jgi:hypothetical protein
MINIKEHKYKQFVLAHSEEESWIPQCYKEAPECYDTLEEAQAHKNKSLNIYEFDVTKHQVTHAH